jgi:CspA family cold shock protein
VRGTVSSFDEQVGLGHVEHGGHRYLFHCTQIVDGTRTIPVGTQVSFRLVPAHLGQWEAIDVAVVAPD